MIHHAAPLLIGRRVVVHLAGCGGNGSLMLSGLARLDHAIRALGHPGLEISVFDPDRVAEANVARQLFYPSDIGRPKATMLVHRVNQCFGSAYEAHAKPYTADTGADLLITCVDSARARVAIGTAHYRCMASNASYWLDLGNRAADGQVVLGFNRCKRNQTPASCEMPDVLDLYPEMAAGTVPDDDAPSCSLAEALERQQLFINQFIVTEALEILWKLFRFGQIDYHGAFVNLNPRFTRRLDIDAEVWKRFGWPAETAPASTRKPTTTPRRKS